MATSSHLSVKAKWLTLVEQCFAVVAIIIFVKAFIFQIFTNLNQRAGPSIELADNGPLTDVHPGLLFVYMVVYCITAFLTMTRWRELLQYLRQEKFVFLLLLLAALSVFWSTAPGITLARSVALGGTTLFGLYWVMSFSVGQQLRFLAIAFYVIIVSSFLVALLYPGIGIMTGVHEGLWRGVLIHKNLLAKAIIVGSIAFFILAAKNPRRSYLYWPGFWLALLLLLMTGSKSSMLSYIILFTGLSAYLAAVRHYRLLVVALLSVLIVSASLVSMVKYTIYPPIIISHLTACPADMPEDQCSVMNAIVSAAPPGANSEALFTGTGRTVLWISLWELAQLKPWLGYGYGFWLDTTGPLTEIWREYGNGTRHGHNGFLDLVLELGLLGLALFVAAFSISFRKALGSLRDGQFDPLKLYFPMVLVYVVLGSIGESDLLAPNSIFWILIVSAFFHHSRHLSSGSPS